MLKLNSQQFGNIFEALRQSGSSGGSDKRQATRMDVQARITLATLAGNELGRVYTALTRDVSTCGVGLFQHFPIEQGARFLAGFPSGKSELVIVCTNRFCRAMAEGMFGVGGEFTELADEAMVKQFRDSQSGEMERIRNSILG